VGNGHSSVSKEHLFMLKMVSSVTNQGIFMVEEGFSSDGK
jgi:hypothetical protein